MGVEELQVRCRREEHIDAVQVSMVIEGFAKLELEFTPPGLASFVEINLPKVIGEMDPKNVVLSVPALHRIHGVPATDTFCVPVFARVLEMMPQQQSNVVASFVEAAVRLRFAHRDFFASIADMRRVDGTGTVVKWKLGVSGLHVRGAVCLSR